MYASSDMLFASTVVSVIIPAFNVAPYVGRAIRSVLAQTVSDFEIVVVDDGSTDGTGKVVESIRDDRLKLIRKTNGGCASARNAGLSRSQGEYAAFLDGDDRWLPGFLERHLTLLERLPEVDLTFSLSAVVDEQDRTCGLMKPGGYNSFSFRDLIVENPVGNGSAAVIRRRAIELAGPFDESLPASSDCDMWLRIADLRPGNFVRLPEVLTCYRRRDGQTTGNWRRMRAAYEQVMDKARLHDRAAVDSVDDLSRCNKYRYHAFVAYEAGDLLTACRLLRGQRVRVVENMPTQLKVLAAGERFGFKSVAPVPSASCGCPVFWRSWNDLVSLS